MIAARSPGHPSKSSPPARRQRVASASRHPQSAHRARAGSPRPTDRRPRTPVPVHSYLDLGSGSSLDHLQAASIQYRIAIGPHAGRKALTLCSVPPVEGAPNNQLLARLTRFSLHAATVCEAHQRSRKERLCRYITRPPIATQRLRADNRRRVVYHYKQPFLDGSTLVVLEPLGFMSRIYGILQAELMSSVPGREQP